MRPSPQIAYGLIKGTWSYNTRQISHFLKGAMGKIKIKGKNQARFLKEVTFEQDYEALVGFFAEGDRDMRSRKSENILDLIAYSRQLVNVS